ncbi:MAG: hypothetical protein ACK559_34810, partial [bacterium]
RKVGVTRKPGGVEACRQPQVLPQQVAHLGTHRVLTRAVLAHLHGRHGADVPVLGDVVDNPARHQLRAEVAAQATLKLVVLPLGGHPARHPPGA